MTVAAIGGIIGWGCGCRGPFFQKLSLTKVTDLLAVENWDQMESMFDYIYTKCLNVESSEHPVMMSEAAVGIKPATAIYFSSAHIIVYFALLYRQKYNFLQFQF